EHVCNVRPDDPHVEEGDDGRTVVDQEVVVDDGAVIVLAAARLCLPDQDECVVLEDGKHQNQDDDGLGKDVPPDGIQEPELQVPRPRTLQIAEEVDQIVHCLVDPRPIGKVSNVCEHAVSGNLGEDDSPQDDGPQEIEDEYCDASGGELDGPPLLVPE